MAGPDALELAGQVAGDLGRGVVDGPDPAAMARPGPGLAQPGRALAGQLDLDRDPLRERVDVLAVQAGASGGVRVVRELDGGVGDVALAGLPAQLPLAEPAAPGGDAWLQGQADHADGVDVGELGDDEGPGAHVQADQPQGLSGGGDPQVAQQAVAGDQPRSSQRSTTSRRVVSPIKPSTLGEPGDSRPRRTRRTSERAAYCWPSQRRAATSRSVMPASVSHRGRRDEPPAGLPAPDGPVLGPWTCGPGRMRPARKKPSSGM